MIGGWINIDDRGIKRMRSYQGSVSIDLNGLYLKVGLPKWHDSDEKIESGLR
uniref:Uncharacterized protein n=1 Tax=Meloidogyne enterolobii TaxID=390850 RepID=A0A6V7WA73_MELEN|nr:unnamed protein product [Meloidogyne enterolobii]